MDLANEASSHNSTCAAFNSKTSLSTNLALIFSAVQVEMAADLPKIPSLLQAESGLGLWSDSTSDACSRPPALPSALTTSLTKPARPISLLAQGTGKGFSLESKSNGSSIKVSLKLGF